MLQFYFQKDKTIKNISHFLLIYCIYIFIYSYETRRQVNSQVQLHYSG